GEGGRAPQPKSHYPPQPPQPPPQPPPPQPPPPSPPEEPQLDDPHPELHDDFCLGRKYRAKGNAEVGTAARPNRAAVHSSSLVPAPGRIERMRPLRSENRPFTVW